MPEEEEEKIPLAGPIVQNTAEQLPGFVFVDDNTKMKQMSSSESTRLELKQELSLDKKQITVEVKQSTEKAMAQAKMSAKKGNPQSVSDIKSNIEIASKIDNSKTNLGYVKKEAMLDKIREELKGGDIKDKEGFIPGVVEPVLGSPIKGVSEE